MDLLLEIGSEELPVGDLDRALAQLRDKLAAALQAARLRLRRPERARARRAAWWPRCAGVRASAPTRSAWSEARRRARRLRRRGPAHQGRARALRAARGVEVSALERRTLDGKEYVVAVSLDAGRDASAVLAELLPSVIAALQLSPRACAGTPAASATRGRCAGSWRCWTIR